MKNHPSRLLFALAAITAIFFSSAAPLWAATITWINTSGGNWNAPGNWNPNAVPGAGDTAQINTAGTYTVIVNDTESAASLTVGGSAGAQTLQVNTGGVLNDAGGTVAATGAMTVGSGGTLNVSSTLYLYGPLTNAGTMNLTNVSIGLYNNNDVPNAGGIDNQGEINFYGGFGNHINSGGEGYEYFINEGTVSEKPSAGTSSIGVGVGSLEGIYNAALGTTLQFSGGPSVLNPLMVGTPPELNGPGQYQFTSGYLLLTVDMIPGLTLTGGTLELGPTFQAGGAITNLTLDGITLAAGSYQVNGTLTVSNNSTVDGAMTVTNGGVLDVSVETLAATGTLTVQSGGTLNVASTLYLYGPLNNAGTINLTNASIGIYNNDDAPNAGGIDNQGMINFYGGFGDHINSGGEGYEYMINQGTVNEKAGAGTSSIGVDVGSLEGIYNAALGTTLQFSGGPSVLNPLMVGTPPELNGPGQYQFTSGYLLLTVDMIPGLTLTGGTLELGPTFQAGGAITNLTLDGITLAAGSYQVNGTLTVSNNSTVDGAMTVTNGGVLDVSVETLAATGTLTVQSGGTLNVASTLYLYGPLNNAGTINLTNASIGIYNNNDAPNAGGIDNQGTINFYGGFGDHINSGGEGYEYMINQGTVNEKVGAGTSSIGVDVGSLEGIYNAALGTTLQFSGGPSVLNPLMVGTPPELNGPGQYQFTSGYLLLTVDMIPGLTLTGGTLELGPTFQAGGAITNLTLDGMTLGTGSFQVNGTLTVTNSTIDGAVTVTNGGVLDESGMTLATTGTLTVQSGGTLNVASALYLYGPLNNTGTINLTNASIGIYNNNDAPNAGGIDNQGMINFYGGFGDHINSGGEGYEYMINQGTVNEKAGAGTSSIGVDVGSLEGIYNAALGTTLQFSGGPSVLNPLMVGTPPELNGPGQYQFTSGYLLLTVDMIPGLTLTGGTLELGPTFQAGGAITNLTLDGMTLGTGSFQVNGTLTVTNSTIDGAVTVTNGGVLDESGVTLATTGTLTVQSGGTLNVASALYLYGPLNNAGTMNLTNASIDVYNNNEAPNAGGIVNQGEIDLYGASGDHINSGGEGHEYLSNPGTISQRLGTGSSSINVGLFTDSGTVDSQEGTLTLSSLPLQASSVLNFGVNSATDSGKIAVLTNVVLTGTVSANLNNGFVPAKGDEFNVLSVSSTLLLSGLFANTNFPAAAPGQAIYGADVFSLLFNGNGTPPSQPLLTIERASATTVDVSWPTAAGNFNLQITTGFSPASWSNITNGITTDGPNFVLTYTVSSEPAFFRLKSQ